MRSEDAATRETEGEHAELWAICQQAREIFRAGAFISKELCRRGEPHTIKEFPAFLAARPFSGSLRRSTNLLFSKGGLLKSESTLEV